MAVCPVQEAHQELADSSGTDEEEEEEEEQALLHKHISPLKHPSSAGKQARMQPLPEYPRQASMHA